MKVEASKIMSRDNESLTLCPKFQQAFAILGKKWNGLIIQVLLDGPHRFRDITEKIPEVSDRVLVERLKELEAVDIVTKDLDETCQLNCGYMLTEKGYDLKQALVHIQKWANRWITL